MEYLKIISNIIIEKNWIIYEICRIKLKQNSQWKIHNLIQWC